MRISLFPDSLPHRFISCFASSQVQNSGTGLSAGLTRRITDEDRIHVLFPWIRSFSCAGALDGISFRFSFPPSSAKPPLDVPVRNSDFSINHSSVFVGSDNEDQISHFLLFSLPLVGFDDDFGVLRLICSVPDLSLMCLFMDAETCCHFLSCV
ncbi:hypothetical protein L218DRAFT_57861 [Marasmius fiardii PR-910]|nr:hypothetical protein L218DRAFT_57861 [Marasmius fiardii PR-910]